MLWITFITKHCRNLCKTAHMNYKQTTALSPLYRRSTSPLSPCDRRWRRRRRQETRDKHNTHTNSKAGCCLCSLSHVSDDIYYWGKSNGQCWRILDERREDHGGRSQTLWRRVPPMNHTHNLNFWCHIILAFAPTFASTLSWCYLIYLMYQMILDTDEEVG